MNTGQSSEPSVESSARPFWWEADIERLRERYRSAAPFPHVVIDNFLEPERCRRIVEEEFGDVGSPRWTYHRHYSQKTYSRSDFASFRPTTRCVFEQLGSSRVIDFVTRLTGIRGLFLHPELEDGGLAACRTGGFANIHTDMMVHPTHRNWLRRVNLIWYLNEDWQPEYQGDLELWDESVRRCVQRIAPLFNRAVIFEVGDITMHGYPEILRCPPDRPRKSVAFYYFTEETEPVKVRYFVYHARPGDGLKHLWVAIDNMLIHTYERVRQPLGIDDRFVNRVMRLCGIGRE